MMSGQNTDHSIIQQAGTDVNAYVQSLDIENMSRGTPTTEKTVQPATEQVKELLT